MSFSPRLVLPVALLAIVVSAAAAVSPRAATAQIPGDLAVTKGTSILVSPGATLTYLVTISNVGAGPREMINFTDTLPTNTTYVAGSWTQTSGPPFVLNTVGTPVTQVTASRVLTLNGGESATFSFQVIANAGLVNGSTIVNICQVSTTSTAFPETNTGNNSCTFTTVVVLPPTPIPTPALTPAPTTVPATAVPTATPTVTPIIPPVVIPQVFQHVPQGIFNGSRNNTPTPVRPSAAAVAAGAPAAMPQVRPPSTGESGLADNGASNVVYGLAFIAALGVVTFGATRLKAVRNR